MPQTSVAEESEAIEATDYEDDSDEALDALIENLGIDLVFEERPKQTRAERSLRPRKPPVPWEQVLNPVRENPSRDVSLKAFSGELGKGRARGLAAAIRTRLFSVNPSEQWDIGYRYVGSQDVWKVYAKFVRNLTKPETEKRIAERQVQSEKLRQARELRSGATG